MRYSGKWSKLRGEIIGASQVKKVCPSYLNTVDMARLDPDMEKGVDRYG